MISLDASRMLLLPPTATADSGAAAALARFLESGPARAAMPAPGRSLGGPSPLEGAARALRRVARGRYRAALRRAARVRAGLRPRGAAPS